MTMKKKNAAGKKLDRRKISKKLRPKQRRFVAKYADPSSETFGNGTKSAIAAGYSERSARQIGHETLKKPEIQREIERVLYGGRAGVVAVEGARLHYKIEGSGIPLLLIGGPQLYPPVFSQELREHFQLIFVPSRLFVPTEAGFDVSSITLDTLAEDVEAIRPTLNLERTAVLGHSLHGLIALEYGRKLVAVPGIEPGFPD